MLLALDTCGSLGGVALGDPSRRAGENSELPAVRFRELGGRTYSEQLLSTVSELLDEAGIALSSLSGIVVVRGPGSFTGIRIGVSAAKGLAEGLAVPVIAISRLALLAARAPGEGEVLALLDAGRAEFYAGLFRPGVAAEETLLTREELLRVMEDARVPALVCEERVGGALPGARMVAAPTAVEALLAGAARFRDGLFDDVVTLEANYVRRTGEEMLARIAEHAALRAEASGEG